MFLLQFLGILSFFQVIAGAHRAVCSPDPVEAEEGGDETLRCRLDAGLDLVNYTTDWKRVDLNDVVHAYRHKRDDPGPQMARYRGRTSLSHDDLRRGVLTLRISSLQVADSGPYKCFVPRLKAGCTVRLTVVRRGRQKTTAGPPVDPSDGEIRRLVGVIVTIVVVIIIIVVIIVLVLKRRSINCMKSLGGRKESGPKKWEKRQPAGNIV